MDIDINMENPIIVVKHDDKILNVNVNDYSYLVTNQTNEIKFKSEKMYGLGYSKRYNSNPKFIENTNICYYENKINDNFDDLALKNKGMYIMKKWCREDVESTIHQLFKIYRTKILWASLKTYVFSKSFRNLLIKNKITKLTINIKKFIIDEKQKKQREIIEENKKMKIKEEEKEKKIKEMKLQNEILELKIKRIRKKQ